MVRTKRIYDPAEPADGVRVLVMRLWPRGIRKSAADVWLKELGAGLDNLKAWHAGRIDWPEMRKRYLAGLEAPPASEALAELTTLARRRTVTLLCSCVDAQHCHRTILKEVLTGSRPRAASSRPTRSRAPGAPARKRRPSSLP